MSDTLEELRDRWQCGVSPMDEEDMGQLINLLISRVNTLDALTRVWRVARMQPDRHREEMGDTLVRIAWQAGEITEARAAELLGCSIVDVRELEWEDLPDRDDLAAEIDSLRTKLAAAEAERDLERKDRTFAEFEMLALRDRLSESEAKIKRLNQVLNNSLAGIEDAYSGGSEQAQKAGGE